VVTFVNAINTDDMENSIFISREEYEKNKTRSIVYRRAVEVRQNRGHSLTKMINKVSTNNSKSVPKVIRRVAQKIIKPTPVLKKFNNKTQTKPIYRPVISKVYKKNMKDTPGNSRKYIARSHSPNYFKERSQIKYSHVQAKVSSRRLVNDPALNIQRKPQNFIVKNIHYVRELSAQKKQDKIENANNRNNFYSYIPTHSNQSIHKRKYIPRKSKNRIEHKVRVKPTKKYLQKLQKHGHQNKFLSKKKYLEKFKIRKNTKVVRREKTEIERISDNINRSKSPKSKYYY
jgi:hypothetical protein